jgi:hypothetical protein
MTTPHGSHVPLPGRHLSGHQAQSIDPAQVRVEVDELLAGLSGGAPVAHRARILEEAHEVLVRALGAVDKI